MIFEKEDVQIAKQQFLHNLRSQTSTLHTQLEKLPISLKLTSADLSIKDYIHYLQLMQPVICFTENEIFPVVKNVVDDIDERKKQHLIKKDLQYLKAASSLKKFTIEDYQIHDVSFALGVLYVIEGSTLGGRVILKNIQHILNLNEENGASYFAGYRDKTGSLWKHFLNKLTSCETQTKTQEKIIAGANAAFKSIYNFMQ